MALKPVLSKEEFVSDSGTKKTLPLPRGPRKPKNLATSGPRPFKILSFGHTGTGKTDMLSGLLLHGLKVFCLSTDIGGDGLNTVTMHLKRQGKEVLIANCFYDAVDDAYVMRDFLREPTKVYPDFHDYDFDFLVWDGFSSFQQNHLPTIVGDMVSDKSSKEIAEVREEGLQFEISDWGIFRNMTVRAVDSFLTINHPSGKIYHKLITCLEGIKSVSSGGDSKTLAQTTYRETREPFLQGSAVKLIGPAFDLILNTRIEAKAGEEAKRQYKYVCAGHDSLGGAKTRGLILPPTMPGDMYELWNEIVKQLEIKKDAVAVTEAVEVPGQVEQTAV